MAGGHTLNIKQGPGPRNGRHPSRIRAGQLFFPRSGSQRLRFVVKQLDGEWVCVLREDGSKGRVSLDRLSATDGQGNGANYRFHGWKRLPRGYRTELRILRVHEETGRCSVVLPEWDPSAAIDVPLATLPEVLRTAGGHGSCRADLTATSEAGLDMHGFSAAKVRGLSRTAVRSHPELVAEGQKYRRRSDGKKFRLLKVGPDAIAVSAWTGTRVVRLDPARLLATRLGGREGLHYTYLGGGLVPARRRRGRHPGRRSG